MELRLKRWFRGDTTVWVIFTLLCVISFVECFSAIGTLSYGRTRFWAPIWRHGFFLLVGYVIVVAFHNFSYKKWTSMLAYLLPVVSIGLLLLTLFKGVEANGATRWLRIFGFELQPSELAKVSLVFYVAWTLGKAHRSEDGYTKAFWKVLVMTAIMVLLIVFDNMSTAILIMVFVYIMLWVGNTPKRLMLPLTLIGVGAGLLLFLMLYAIPSVPGVDRWTTWHNRLQTTEKIAVTDPAYRMTDDNLQQHYAKIAVASGRVVGCLPGNSTQRDFLPQAYSDFIYAIAIEDLGWLGLFGIPLLYISLLFRCVKIAKKCPRPVPSLLVMGCGLIICLQAFINMAVAVGFFPVTGQPLPLVSRGGTSGIITCVYVAAILSVSRFADEEEKTVLDREAAQDQAEWQAELEERARREAEAFEQSATTSYQVTYQSPVDYLRPGDETIPFEQDSETND